MNVTTDLLYSAGEVNFRGKGETFYVVFNYLSRSQSPLFVNILRSPEIDFQPAGIDSWTPKTLKNTGLCCRVGNSHPSAPPYFPSVR